MNKKILPLGAIGANCVVLWNDPAAAWIVDPGAERELLLDLLAEDSLTPVLIALTHGHFDHIGAIPALSKKFPGLPVHIGPDDAPIAFDPRNAWEPDYSATSRPATLVADLVDGFTLAAGGLSAKIIATPGHTSGGVCFHFEADQLLLSGDTLFAGSCGRTDFPGGDAASLRTSLRRLAALPPATAVIPGHGEPTTIAAELVGNPFLNSHEF